jgi:hypothetical protein
MNAIYPFQKSPRCTAMSKRTRKPCRAPAVRGWGVCRFHGARSGAPKGVRNGSYKDGLHTKEAIEERRQIKGLLKEARDTLSAITNGA